MTSRQVPNPWLDNLELLWEQPQGRAAVAGRDVAEVYRLLQRVGLSQRKIALMTSQNLILSRWSPAGL